MSRRFPDAEFVPIIDALSRRLEGGEHKWINYRDLSVQQLGSIYERLLEYAATLDGDGTIVISPNIYARRTSGSFYTHDDLVSLIIERTVGLLLAERRRTFHAKVEKLRSSRRRRADRIAELRRHHPGSAFLDLKICDPAMGSAHFLVSLVDYLADHALEAIAEAEAAVDWAGEDQPYRSPLVERIETIREHILELAAARRWAIDREQLDDRHIVRRMILKRVIYGVDKNPMAVELAKVSLWLHTFTVGAPLSFLDHHLRCGDSLFGEWLGPAMLELAERYALLINPYVQQARHAIAGMRQIEDLSDADIAEVQTSSTTYEAVAADTEPLRRFLDFRHSLRWLGTHRLTGRNVRPELIAIFDGSFGDPFLVIAGKIPVIDDVQGEAEMGDIFDNVEPREVDLAAVRRMDRDTRQAADTMLREAREVGNREHFFHWQIEFPGVWRNWEGIDAEGGFDAVIGNPPWDRIKLQEVEWFAARRPEIARTTRASDRRRMIQALREGDDPLWRSYLAAKERAETMAATARATGDYPLLSRGDINLYALFVERAHGLIKSDGLVGLLVPSGIASDLSASRFFRGISTASRLATLFDFENKGVFFPDVHASFKFCIYVASGIARTFAGADCAFYLHDVSELTDPERLFVLRAEDFSRVNPNTGTAPIFRTRRDAELTTATYARVPVLVDRRTNPPTAVWPVRYFTMFHMTNDAQLFRTQQELEADGFYQAVGNRWRRGDEECVLLYEGKMLQAYDHRAASVIVNPENLNRPAQPEAATSDQHANPNWVPIPQYWVSESAVLNLLRLTVFDGHGGELDQIRVSPDWFLSFKDVTAPTNIRTMIAGIIPALAVGNTLPVLLPAHPRPPNREATAEAWREFAQTVEEEVRNFINYAPLLLANLNTFIYDFHARQKVHGQHLNYFIVEQLPLIPVDTYQRRFGEAVAAEIVRLEVLHLTYTAFDLQPFAHDMGYQGPPFEWDEVDRRHRRARLDALFFHLYGVGREDAAYILDTFPIVKAYDEATFDRFLTRDLILAYMNTLSAGDSETVVAL